MLLSDTFIISIYPLYSPFLFLKFPLLLASISFIFKSESPSAINDLRNSSCPFMLLANPGVGLSITQEPLSSLAITLPESRETVSTASITLPFGLNNETTSPPLDLSLNDAFSPSNFLPLKNITKYDFALIVVLGNTHLTLLFSSPRP